MLLDDATGGFTCCRRPRVRASRMKSKRLRQRVTPATTIFTNRASLTHPQPRMSQRYQLKQVRADKRCAQ